MDNKNPDLSIIVISYNTEKLTKECIESIYNSFDDNPHVPHPKLKFEIIVIDNNSKDKSIEVVKKLQEKYKNIELIQNKENVGFAKANNLGLKNAKGKYILFLNSDIVVLKKSLEKLYYFYIQSDEEFHFIGGKLLNKDKTPQPSCGPFFTIPVLFAFLFLRGDRWNMTRYSPNNIKEVDWVSGACILARKEYFKKLGGFDENIFMYMDEVELFYRAKKKRYSVFFYPDAEFIHYGSASSNRTFPVTQAFKGFMYFYKKHHPGELSFFLLKIMLKLKAIIALAIGKATRNQYLIKTYEEAYKLT